MNKQLKEHLVTFSGYILVLTECVDNLRWVHVADMAVLWQTIGGACHAYAVRHTVAGALILDALAAGPCSP